MGQFSSTSKGKGTKLPEFSMMFFVFQVFLFAISVNESLGCFNCPSGRSLSERDSGDMESVHWTFGVCSEDEETCLEERYDGKNFTTAYPVDMVIARIRKIKINAPEMNLDTYADVQTLLHIPISMLFSEIC